MAVRKIVVDGIKDKITDISCGLLATITDLSLFAILNLLNASFENSFKYSVGKVASISADEAMDQLLDLGIDKESIKRAFWKLSHRKWIKRVDNNRKEFSLTETSYEKLKGLLPIYNSKRDWDNHLYLITYDIPEEARRQRNILRNYLKDLHCGLLQDSVWLTPYNPKSILKKFILEKEINGSIIVSDVGKEGGIGDEDLDDLVTRVFNLNKLNGQYREFIQSLKVSEFDKISANFKFLSILKEDPQLPFEILPYDWLGDKAYQYLKEFNTSN